MAITVIDPEENRNRLIGQISQNLQANRELEMRRMALLEEAKRAERAQMVDNARLKLQQRQLSLDTKKLGQERRQADIDVQMKAGSQLGLKPAKRSELMGMTPRSRMEALKAAQNIGGRKFVPDARLNAARQGIVFNPNTGQYQTPSGEQVNFIPKGAQVRNLPLSPETVKERKLAEGEASTQTEQKKIGTKLAGLSKKLNVLRVQYDKALPDSAKNDPSFQRLAGPISVLGAKTGLVPNKDLLAVQKNARLQAIQAIKMAGEAGNLAQQEQSEAVKAIESAGLTTDERKASVKQFMEFALAGMTQDAADFLAKDKGFVQVLNDVGVDFDLIGMKNPNIDESVPKEVLDAIRASGLQVESITKREDK